MDGAHLPVQFNSVHHTVGVIVVLLTTVQFHRDAGAAAETAAATTRWSMLIPTKGLASFNSSPHKNTIRAEAEQRIQTESRSHLHFWP